jgi:hypothetical protein
MMLVVPTSNVANKSLNLNPRTTVSDATAQPASHRLGRPAATPRREVEPASCSAVGAARDVAGHNVPVRLARSGVAAPARRHDHYSRSLVAPLRANALRVYAGVVPEGSHGTTGGSGSPGGYSRRAYS